MQDTIVKNRLDSITDAGYREYLDSGETATIAESLGEVHGFTERQFEVLENAIDLYLLCLLTETTLIQFIERQCSLSSDEAEILATAIKLALPAEIRTARQYPEQLLRSTGGDITHDIAETEAALARVAPVRTMARDMHDLESQAPAEAPVYRSEQPARGVGTPPPPAPRWGSEQQ